MNRLLLLLLSIPYSSDAKSVEVTSVYEISELKGSQTFYASHFKPDSLRDPKKIDNEDRAALLGALGKTGIAMPRLKEPYVNDTTRVQGSTISFLTLKEDDGSKTELALNEYKEGKDNLLVFKNDDSVMCLLIGEGSVQLYTLHLNVTFPDGEKLVTMQATRNVAIGVSTTNVSGKARRVK